MNFFYTCMYLELHDMVDVCTKLGGVVYYICFMLTQQYHEDRTAPLLPILDVALD